MRIGLTSPQAVLALLIRRRWWIIAPFVALTCMVTVLANRLPKSFVSESLIMVRQREMPANFVVDLTPGSVADRMKNLEQTVLSRTALDELVSKFGARMAELKGLNREERRQEFRSHVDIKYPMNPAKPNQQLPITYFRVTFRSQDQFLAQEVVRELTTRFITEDSNYRNTQVNGPKTFFSNQLEEISQALKESEARLNQKKAARQYELPERLDMNMKKLELLGQQARTNEEAIGRNASTRVTYEQMLAETPATLVKAGPNAGPGPAAGGPPKVAVAEDQKIIDYRNAKHAFEKLAADYPAAHPDVRSAKVTLDNLRARLSAEEIETVDNPPPPPPPPAPAPTAPNVPPGSEPNPRYQTLLASLREAETEAKILQNQKAEIARDIATYSRRVDSTPQVELELADLLRENTSLHEQYESIKGKLAATELSSSLETADKGGFYVQDPASLPLDAATPSKKLIVLGGSAASLLFSLVFAVVVDVARQRIWTQAEIETFWGVPVLVDIPEILTDMDLAAARRKKWIFAASAMGAALVYSVCLYGVDLNHEFILRQLDPVVRKIMN